MPIVSRLAAYGLLSSALAAAVVGSALKTRPNFYAAAVAVGRSSGSLIVLANFALYNAICISIAFKRVFFGQLRAVEYEHLFDRLWIFLTESLLALTIFRDDYSVPFAILYGILVFLKCFHWVTADRVDYMDQIPPPGPPRSFHLRIAAVMALLTFFDLALVVYATECILVDGVSAMILFASEFTILLAAISGTWARYIVGVVDLHRAGGRPDAPSWQEKSMYLFYIDLAVDFVKLLTYLVFFTVILLNYGLPLHILRDVYMTLRSFIARCGDLVRYRRATRNMDALYPDASAEDLDRLGDRTCIICREEMVAHGGQGTQEQEVGEPQQAGPNETPKKLACGHVFHFHCLRSWLERQQSCPTCRRDVFRSAPLRRPEMPNGAPPPRMPVPGAAPGADVRQPILPDPTRALFEDYFQQPAPNGDTPIPLAMPARDPQAASNNLPDATSDDRRVQRSIWGVPIVPGQFHPPPLGAAPRWPRESAGPSNHHQLPGLTRVSSTNRPSQTEADPSTHADESQISPPLQSSGVTTPFASQAPTVFSSTGLSRSTDEETGEQNNAPARRAAAEAAMRRMGIGSRTTSMLDKGKTKEESELLPPTPPPPHPPLGEGLSFNVEPTHRPFLTPITLPLFPTSSAASVVPRTPEAARAALDERLRALRDVDNVVWSLVGELSRLKSAWMVEDDVDDGI